MINVSNMRQRLHLIIDKLSGSQKEYEIFNYL